MNHCDVLILGASFTGMELVWKLRDQTAALDIVVIDRESSHPYIPLAHEDVLQHLDAKSCRLASRARIEQLGARFVQGEIESFEAASKSVHLSGGEQWQGKLVVIALGSVSDRRLGTELLHLKFSKERDHCRAQIRERQEKEVATRVLIVGGGLSGVELAGEFAALQDSHSEHKPVFEITLVHRGDSLLPGLGSRAGRLAETYLRKQGVDVRLRCQVKACEQGSASLIEENQESLWLRYDLAFAAGGPRPAALLAKLGLACTSEGWLRVNSSLQCLDEEDSLIFAAGDAVRIEERGKTWPTMKRAIECIWQANILAKNIRRLSKSGALRHGQRVAGPSLVRHRLRRDFFHGVSLGTRSLITWGPLVLDLGRMGVLFRRWLMRQYFRRYQQR